MLRHCDGLDQIVIPELTGTLLDVLIISSVIVTKV